MELELISSMKRNLSRHLKEETKVGFDFPQWQAITLKELKGFQRENKEIIGNYTNKLSNVISKQLKNELKKGSKRELKKYKQLNKSSKNLNSSFFNLNDKKIVNLIKEVQGSNRTANTACFRMMNDQYRKVINKAAMFSNNGVISPKQAIDMATRDFLTTGINCIQYKNGTRVNIADYCDMAVRTANTRAQLIGEGQFRQELGEHLVKPTKHNSSCEKCAKWEGKILIDDVYSGGTKEDGKYPLLSEAIAQGFFHPRCEHGLPTYYKELEDIEFDDNGPTENTLKSYQEDLNWINSNIQKYERLVAGSLDDSNIKKYKDKKYLYEKKKDEVLKIINNYGNFDDVTKEWLDKANPSSHKVLNRNYFEYNDVRYKVDGKNVVLDYSKHEKEVAEWLEKTFGGEIYMLPRVNSPKNIETPDYLFRKEYWDLKEITGNGKHTLDSAIKKKKNQSQNFIFDIGSSEMNIMEAEKQINKIMSSKDRHWVKKIIVKNNEIVKVYKKRD